MRNAGGSLDWFRQDLRLADNPTLLLAAVRYGGLVLPVFIWAPDEEGQWPPVAASRWWLHQTLTQLDAFLRRLGSRLIMRRGPTLETLRSLLKQSGSTAVFWNRRYEPAMVERDSRVKAALQKERRIVGSFNGSLLFEPWTVQTQQGKPYQVFTPFWKACLAMPEFAPPEDVPSRFASPRRYGADAAPYFRIFNPVTQGEKFDPHGDYVRHWILELKKLPTEWIHKPWEAPAHFLQDAGIDLQST